MSISPEQHAAKANSVDSQNYTRVAILLHWLIAGLILCAIILGIFGANVEGQSGQSATNLHKSFGIIILSLTLLRIFWRLGHRPPALPETMSSTLRLLAKASHFSFYILMLALPLTGWWMTSAFPKRHSFGIFGLFDIPFLPVAKDMAMAIQMHDIHVLIGWGMIALIMLHVLAALKHHYIDQDDILRRMLGRGDHNP